MDSAAYCQGSGTDVDMNRMFDQYLFKGAESFDLSLSIPDASAQNNNAYMSSDQTFHTPNFGDEEFEIPPISLPQSTSGDGGGEMNSQGYNPSTMNHPGNMADNVPVMTLGGNVAQQSMAQQQPIMMAQATHYSPHGIYLTQMGDGSTMMTSQANVISSQSFDTQPTYTLAEPQTSHHLILQSQPQAQQHAVQQQSMMGTTTLLTTISPAPLSSHQIGLQFMAPRAPSSVSGSPPGSNHTSPGPETSEDSDDSAHHSQHGGPPGMMQMMGGIKRPSPEPADLKSANAIKKPKVPKKKKKRDPNEPQKPVSAYALFFRDTQAAIKGQNPNASFGEVSKIVAAMWDGLDAEHKNVYKKKTEAAKKEYLKALAAYRASLVSKQTTSDHSDNVYNSGPSYNPPNVGSYNQPSSLNTSNVMMAPSLPQIQPQPHPQVSHSAQMISVRPHPQNSPMGQHPSQHQPMGVGGGGGGGNGGGGGGQNYPQQSNYPQQNNMTSSQQQSLSNAQPVSTPQQALSSRSITCLRNGCPNPAIESPDWDSEYCSNECVVSHCRDVFTAWVASRQTSNTFASVK